MRRDLIEGAMRRSSKSFMEHGWPLVSDRLGGGRVAPVECVTSVPFARDLDVLAGIDLFQIDGLGMRGIASRVQYMRGPSPKAWPSHTIRYRLISGNDTEFQKRCASVLYPDRGHLHPHWTSQLYMDFEGTRPLGIGVVKTKSLYEWVAQAVAREEENACGPLWEGYGCEAFKIQVNTDEAGRPVFFLCVWWRALERAGIEIIKWLPIARAA